MSNTKKQPQEAQVGRRIWAILDGVLQPGSIHTTYNDRDAISLKVGDHPYQYSIPTYPISSLGKTWGFLADDETVIGGVLVKPGSLHAVIPEWNIGDRIIFASSVLAEDIFFIGMCNLFKMTDADKTAIQDHVRKHSAPVTVPKKRTAADAKEGDEVWVRCPEGIVEGKIKTAHLHSLQVHYPGYYACYDREEFGTTWGFPEDRPDTTKALPVDQPAPDEEKPLPPQLGNVALLIKAKGKDWVKANYPDLWDAYKAAGLEKARSAAEKLAKPGPLAGKIPKFH